MSPAMTIRHSSRRAFTLIELLVVCAIIGILATIALGKIERALQKAREGQTVANLTTLRTAINMYAADHEGTWPVSIGGWGPDPGAGGWWLDGSIPGPIAPYLSTSSLPVSYAGKPVFADNEREYGPCVYYMHHLPDLDELGNNRGWIYGNLDGAVAMNNGSVSTTGQKYSFY